jgi:hypothetical protein
VHQSSNPQAAVVLLGPRTPFVMSVASAIIFFYSRNILSAIFRAFVSF